MLRPPRQHTASRRAARRRRLRHAVAACLVGAAPALAAAADRFTLIEGDAVVVVDGARAYAAAPGVVVTPGAIVDTGARTAIARIEFDDGSIVDLGPATRVMMAPRGFAPRERKPPTLYLLSGWVKQASAAAAPAAGFVTAALDVLPFSGTVVVQAAEQQRVFVESGGASLVERRGRGAAPQPLAAGALYGARPGEAGSVAPRPGADFIAALPRLFRDRIPPQAARYKDAKVDPAPLPAPDYAALSAWLTAEPAIRREFPRRFVTLARQPAFRAALEKGLAAHPEWHPVLYPPPPPPKYR